MSDPDRAEPALRLASHCAPALPQDYTIEAFGSLSATPSDATRAASINNRGHVHGEGNKTSLSGAGLQWRGFLWDGLVMKEIQPPVSGSTWSGGLNDDDQCVGYLTAGGVKLDGYVWDDGLLDPVALGTHNYTRSRDINVHGISAGIYTSDVVWSFVYQYRAFLRNGAGTWIDLGAFGDRETHAHALNDWNQATGYSRTNTGQHLGFLWTWSGGLSDLGSLGGTFCDPEDIDNFTRIVGASADAAGVLRPFLWQGRAGRSPKQLSRDVDAIAQPWSLCLSC